LRVFIKYGEVFQMCIAVLDRARIGDHEHELLAGVRNGKRRYELSHSPRDLLVRTVVAPVRAQSVENAEVLDAEIGAVRATVEAIGDQEPAIAREGEACRLDARSGRTVRAD